VRVSAVRFTPAARTAWHSHAVGQTLYVTEGKGLVQARDGAVVEIRPGDIVYTSADEWHWHGAAPDHFMTHLSITEAVPGDARPEANWGEHVTDTEYKPADPPENREKLLIWRSANLVGAWRSRPSGSAAWG
jgi:quercetin dioxygenase-like cupin family protein